MKLQRIAAPLACASVLVLGTVLAIAASPAPRVAGIESGEGTTAAASVSQRVYRLRLYETHRDKSIDVVYRRGNRYVPAAIRQLDYFLRDHLNSSIHPLDPRLFDLLHALTVKVGRPNAVIDIICGYRSPSTNAYLRRHGGGVASHSLHMRGEAIDIRIPGVSTRQLRNAALALARGGVGYYPHSEFVHVDMGRVRRWQYPEPRQAAKKTIPRWSASVRSERTSSHP
jgi:uncharacterized protein YcbK (DUF882 family)